MNTENNNKQRDEKGKFIKGNTSGFKENNKYACKYKEEYCQELLDFFNVPVVQSIEEKRIITNFPTFELFAFNLKVTMETLINWCNQYPSFKDAYAQAKQKQKAMLVEGAVRGLYDANFAKFMAVNNFDMSDKKEVDQKVSGDLAIDDKTLAMVKRVGERMKKEKGDGKK